MQSNTENLIYGILYDYNNQKISLIEALKKLSSIPYHSRDLLNRDMEDFLQEVDLMYEDYIEGYIDVDKKAFEDSIQNLTK